ncbi:MAG: amino acid ABC transporter permease [Pseudomonadota bacterium]|nr:amino acid ABC transporter permease [Pseudomonadota bacterium]
MLGFFDKLKDIRASNIVFVFVIPVIIYVLATSRNYLPALKAVLGVEDDAFILLTTFILLALVGIFTFAGSIKILNSIRLDLKSETIQRSRSLAAIFFVIAFLVGITFHFTSILDIYAISVLTNSGDPRTNDWIIIVDQNFTLTPEIKANLKRTIAIGIKIATIVGLFLILYSLMPRNLHKTLLGKATAILVLVISFSFSFYVIMLAHAGFAVGLMVTLRAAFFAYAGASILGLIWALLAKLSPSKKASFVFGSLGAILIISGVMLFAQKHNEVALVGNYDGKIGIVSGTPQWVADTVRYGDFLVDPPEKPFKIRSLRSLEQGKKLFEKGSISGLVVPLSEVGETQIVWQTDFLPNSIRNLALANTSIGFLILLLVVIGRISNLHPLAVFSEFFVDTMRGIPMIVIILYVGLPLAGAIKGASGGYIDIEMMTRGVIAIAVGYSAYMAEIFRAGIEAIPRGQIEAARTLGLREHQVARFVIIPQAIGVVLPALGNEFIAMLKDTSLLSILSIRDLTQRMREFQAQSFLAFEPFNTAAILYIFLTLLAASGIKSLDKIVNKNRNS